MNLRRSTRAVALAIALGAAATMAQAQRVVVVPQGATVTIETWANDTSVRYYDGRIPRDVYLEEMGRRYDADGNRLDMRDRYLVDWRNRWDLRDPSGRGLTPTDVSRLTGNVDSATSGLPISGAGVQPGNMGPANSKGQ